MTVIDLSPIDLVLNRLRSVKRTSEKQWSACCPGHDDRHASLSVSQGDDGRVLLKCHAGCNLEAICGGLGIELKDLFPLTHTMPTMAPASPEGRWTTMGVAYLTRQDAIQSVVRQIGGRLVTEYCYRDVRGNEVFWVVRFQKPDGKTYRPMYRDQTGWRLGDPPGLLPLYRLSEIQGHKRAYIVEGEKPADAGAEIPLATATSAHGSQAASKTDWKPLAGLEWVIMPDNDDPGQAYVDSLVDIAAGLSPQPRIKIVKLPGLPPHGDLADFIAQRRAVGKTDEEIRKEVEQLADAATPLKLAAAPANVLVYETLPLDALPEGFRGFVDAAANALGCDPAMIAVPALVAAAAAIGNTRRIRIKESWAEPSVVWAVIVAPSGTMKSPALEMALAPVHELQAEALRRFEQEVRDYERKVEEYDAEHAAWEKTREGPEPAQPKPPVQPRYVCSDVTIEALNN